MICRCGKIFERETLCIVNMTNTTCQLAGFIAALVGGVSVLVATILPQWRINGVTKKWMEQPELNQGLWIECVAYPSGQWLCSDVDAFFVGLPLPIQFGRGFSCAANVVGTIAFIFSILGMDCTSCMGSSPTQKQRMGLLAGVFWVLSGLLMGIAVSYYANWVLTEYNGDMQKSEGKKFIYGPCLYIGWTSLILCSVGGGLLVAGSRCDNDEQNISYISTAYRPPAVSTKVDFSTEYV